MINLYPMQEKIVCDLIADLQSQGYAFLKCGQRSGKSIIGWSVMGRTNYSNTRWISTLGYADMQRMRRILNREFAIPQDRTMSFTHTLNKLLPTELVILDEALFLTNAYAKFEQAREVGAHVLILSSRGPAYDSDPRWSELKGHSYNTWDINPHLSKEKAYSFYPDNPEKVMRDFGAF